MVDEEEIIRVAKLMKIDLEDHGEHVSRVKKMLEYFDILDQIDLSSEEITSQQKSLNELRKDEFIPYDKKLIESLKNFREHYVRAPKMNQMNLNTSILKYIEDVKSGKFTVEEFTAATLQRIKDVDEDVHAYLSLIHI